MNPYIGITDFMSFEQVQEMHRIFKKHRAQGSTRQLHVGVMTSHKNIHGLPNKWQDAFPPNDAIATIFSSEEVYNCLHYVDYRDKPNFEESLAMAISLGGAGLHAVQLDMVWPNPRQIATCLNASRKRIEIILQISKNALDEIDNDPQTLIEKFRPYDGVAHRVLLDKSMGKGIGLNATDLLVFAEALKQAFPNLGLGVAGGLGPDTLHLIEPLVKAFADLSIDAQGRLRPSGSALDPIDWNMARDYLVKSLQLFA